MNLFYECSDGTIFDFMDSDISCEHPETLIKRSWNYKSISRINGNNKISRFYKSMVELPLTISIMSDTAEQFNKLLKDLITCFEKDLASLTTGKLWWNDCYLDVFCIVNEPSDFEEYFEAVEQKLTLLCPYNKWFTKRNVIFSVSQDIESISNADFPYEFGDFDFIPGAKNESIEIEGILGADFIMKMYGPCSNPKITIGDNEYAVNDIILTKDEYISINSREKTIFLHYSNGETENIIYKRKDNNVFNKIPAGELIINKNKNMEVAITLFEERGEPEWI